MDRVLIPIATEEIDRLLWAMRTWLTDKLNLGKVEDFIINHDFSNFSDYQKKELNDIIDYMESEFHITFKNIK
jgi:hypothetical protein